MNCGEVQERIKLLLLWNLTEAAYSVIALFTFCYLPDAVHDVYRHIDVKIIQKQ